MKERVQKELNKIRPFIQADGGDIELVDVSNNIVKVKLSGTCGSCPFSQMTLKLRVEKQLIENIPDIKAVEAT
ncbi:MAG: NifU family protein [Candidatus Hodarchaeota archaeon]